MQLEKDFHDSYIRFNGYDMDFIDRYQIRMLSENSISNLLKFSYSIFDSKVDYLFEASQKISIKEYVRQDSISYSFIFQFLQSLLMAVVSLNEHLLDEKCLLMNEACIFMDLNNENFYFCYLPYSKNDIKGDLKALLEFFNRNINNSDLKCESILKELHSDILKDRFFIGMVLENAVNKYYREKNDNVINTQAEISELCFHEEDLSTEYNVAKDSKICIFKDKINQILDQLLNR